MQRTLGMFLAVVWAVFFSLLSEAWSPLQRPLSTSCNRLLPVDYHSTCSTRFSGLLAYTDKVSFVDDEAAEQTGSQADDAILLQSQDVNSEQKETDSSLWKDFPSQSVLLLNVVAVLWGSQHAIIKSVIDDSNDPATFSLLRFGVAALLATPYIPGLSRLTTLPSSDDKTDAGDIVSSWRWGAEMGFWMFLGFSFQAIGLEFTTAQRSGFLLYLNVKFVPFLARFLLGREISPATWASALVAFTGTALLAIGPDQAFALNVGDVWSIAAAAASAMFILRLERASAAVPNAAGLNAACLWVVAALAAVWTLFQTDAASPATTWTDLVNIASSHPLEIIYLSGVTTTLANWIQSKAQREISAERASVIYAMDPVYGAVFSNLLLGETLNGIQAWVGAGLITVAAATNAFLDLSNKSKDPQPTNEKEA